MPGTPRSSAHGGIVVGSPALLQDICDDSVGCLMRLEREYGALVAFPKGGELTVFAFGPEANRAVFADPQLYHIVGPPGPRGSSHRRFQQGLLGLNGAQHTSHRRLLMPALAKEAVLAQTGAMHDLVDRCLESWRPGQRIDLYQAMKQFSLDLAGKLLFGLDEIPRAPALAAAFQSWLDSYISCLFAMSLPAVAPPGSYEQMLAKAEELEAHFQELIALRRLNLRHGDRDLLSVLLAAHEAGRINDTELIGEMHTLLNASYQTTASALTWTLLLLAQHPEVTRALCEPSDGPRMGANAAAYAALLDGVIKESMRLLPPVVFTARRLTAPATLLGCPLPAGTFVMVSIYVTHHQAETFPEPERFLPERWQGRSVSPYAYLPFAAGPRMCLGTMFSMQLFQIAIPAILRRYRLALSPGTRVDRHSNLTLGVRGNLPATVLAQDGRFECVPLTGNIHEMVQFPMPDVGRAAA
jgi:cytochrome P450